MERKSHRKKQFFIGTAALLASFTCSADSDFISKSLLVSISVPAAAAVYSLSIGDTEGSKELLLASAVTLQLTTFLKYTVQRTRPNGDNDLSFPSGHTSGSFVGASYLHHRYGLQWGLPFYAIGAVIGYQRVNVKDHYWSDVLAGAALGYLAGALFTVRYPDAWIEPQYDSTGRPSGVQFKMNFN